MADKKYDHKKIEKKWQKEWEKKKLYKVADSVKDDRASSAKATAGRRNYYTLVEFTYPSGNLHVGHWYAFAVPDIFARYKRMQGYNVLYPMGFDAFGLPAENAAINLGKDPKKWTYTQMDTMRKQLYSMGAMFPWDREVVSCDPEYYKWTQWMFTEFLKNDLVYRAQTKVNWCPKDKTILANEQVIDGKCDRCGTEVIQREQDQWSFRITKYADRLVDDLEKLNWPEEIKSAQRNWIGRSKGSLIKFQITSTKSQTKSNDQNSKQEEIEVFTTRADTLFGVTYVVLAPEHELISKLKSQISNWKEVEGYVTSTKKKSELERQQSKEKTGVELKGIKAINPANGEEVPVWIADYVLAGYGTGAVMAVPAHDERDFEFANKYDLPIKQVVIPEDMFRAVVVAQTLENESEFKEQLKSRGINFTLAISTISKREHIRVELKKEKLDLFITLVQQYIKEGNWVEILGSENIVVLKNKIHKDFLNNVSEWFEKFKEWEPFVRDQKSLWDMLGKNSFLREMICYQDSGKMINSGKFNGLTSEEASKKITDFVGGKMVNTYRLRDWGISRQRYWGVPIPIVYDPDGKAHPVPEKHLPWLLPTDVDHTPDGTSPLARSKELLKRTEKIFGRGWKPEVETMDTFVDSSWYFYRYLDPKNKKKFADAKKMDTWMPVDMYMGGAEHTTMHLLYSRFWVKAMYDLGLVKEDEAYKIRRNRGLILGPDGQKMSKSRGNVVDPDEIVERLGADTVRLYLAFMGPYGVTVNYPWDPNGVVGVRRFLERVWRLGQKVITQKEHSDILENVRMSQVVAKTIKKVSEDIEDFKFNTAISAMMVCLNEWERAEKINPNDFKNFLQLLSTFAPHITEELWHELGEKKSIHLSKWPEYDSKLVEDATVTIAVQVNGKTRGTIIVQSGADELTVTTIAKEENTVSKYLTGVTIIKTIFVPNRLINFVVK